MNPPETNVNLIMRIRDPADRAAWYEFVEIYRPVIQRLASYRGLQPADAEDLTQQVLLSVSGAVDRWEPDKGRAKFRTWLRRIAERAILNALTRRPYDQASGDSATRSILDATTSKNDDSLALATEFRREVFNWAARRIRKDFHESTWNMFWWTTVDGRDVNDVAQDLGVQRGNVYAARSRVMKRLKSEVELFDQR